MEQLRAETNEAQTKLTSSLDSKAKLQEELEEMKRISEEVHEEQRRLREELEQLRFSHQLRDDQKQELSVRTEPVIAPQVEVTERKKQPEEKDEFDMQDYLMHIENSRVVSPCSLIEPCHILT